MAEIETLQDVFFMLKGRIITSISGMFFKREWPTRVETVVEEGRRQKYHSASCLLEAQTAFRETRHLVLKRKRVSIRMLF